MAIPDASARFATSGSTASDAAASGESGRAVSPSTNDRRPVVVGRRDDLGRAPGAGDRDQQRVRARRRPRPRPTRAPPRASRPAAAAAPPRRAPRTATSPSRTNRHRGRASTSAGSSPIARPCWSIACGQLVRRRRGCRRGARRPESRDPVARPCRPPRAPAASACPLVRRPQPRREHGRRVHELVALLGDLERVEQVEVHGERRTRPAAARATYAARNRSRARSIQASTSRPGRSRGRPASAARPLRAPVR